MDEGGGRRYRAGEPVTDLCREASRVLVRFLGIENRPHATLCHHVADLVLATGAHGSGRTAVAPAFRNCDGDLSLRRTLRVFKACRLLSLAHMARHLLG